MLFVIWTVDKYSLLHNNGVLELTALQVFTPIIWCGVDVLHLIVPFSATLYSTSFQRKISTFLLHYVYFLT